MADASFVFNITPRIPIAVLFWDGDDEFPTDAKILFDKTIIKHLSADIIYTLAVDICSRISRAQTHTPHKTLLKQIKPSL